MHFPPRPPSPRIVHLNGLRERCTRQLVACYTSVLLTAGVWLGVAPALKAQSTPIEPPERMQSLRGNFLGQTDRPLRYFPDGHDFVITNGVEFFNRPLYGGNTAFRVDGGDEPEFSLYLPGRGGNLRFAVRTAEGVRWLHDAESIVTRYRPGSLLYEIRDPFIGRGWIELAVIGLYATDGLIARIDLKNADSAVELLWAFGGANGMRGRRGGDIGCESEPIRTFFQLRPEQCADDQVEVNGNTFVLAGSRATIHGVASAEAEHAIAPAMHWNSPERLFASAGKEAVDQPLAIGRIRLGADQPALLALQIKTSDTPLLGPDTLREAFDEAERDRQRLASRVVVATPDPFVNAAATALNVAADAVWDERRASFMHGAVAWRNRLLGWRGMYAGDALGWHERTRRHLAGYAREQITDPIPKTIPAPEASANLSRNETALHSNGNMTRKHYDMNLVAVDAFFRHLLWTGDLEFAREYWPVLERHLAWERRLFRREFGAEGLPLYEGYACFWASDDVAYNGGGSTIGSAYNYYHNKMTAHLAKRLGADPSPYEAEAERIAQGMRRELWLPEQGWFAEYKDLLGRQLVHASPGVWSIYHTIDSELPTSREAWRMTGFVETQLPHIPLHGSHVPPGSFTIPTSTWMPYNWSVNNVVMAEVNHTALACWQANRRDLAFSLFKGALLDSLFMGLCPGNIGMCTEFDAYRHESQRDFADGVGAMSRTLIEGLFGIRPDALAGALTIRPGFPEEWTEASIQHQDLSYTYQRDGRQETYTVNQTFSAPMTLRLQTIALGANVEGAWINGEPATWRWMEGVLGEQRVEIQATNTAATSVRIAWSGARRPRLLPEPTSTTTVSPALAAAPEVSPTDRFDPIGLDGLLNDKVTQIFRNEYLSPRSPFCSLATPKQGIGSWCLPTTQFDVDDSGLRALLQAGNGRVTLPNGVPFVSPSDPDADNIAFVSQWDNYPEQITVPLDGRASHAHLLMAGSTGPMQTRIDNGEVIFTYADGSSDRLPLHNPTTWWPIDQDYFIDDYAFRLEGRLPTRVDLKTGIIRPLERSSFQGRGGRVPGGAATVLDLPINPNKDLQSLTVRALANEVVIGLMSVTLARVNEE